MVFALPFSPKTAFLKAIILQRISSSYTVYRTIRCTDEARKAERPKRQYNVLASTAILLRVYIDICIIGDHLLYFGGLISQTIAATYRLNLSKTAWISSKVTT